MRAFVWSHPAAVPTPGRRNGARVWLAAALFAVGILLGATPALAQRPLPTPLPTPTPKPGGFFLFRSPQKPAKNLVNSTQTPAIIDRDTYAQMNPDSTHVVVSLGRQRAYLMSGDAVAIDSPVSSGRAGHTTPTGSFRVLEKDRNHMSSIYGNYVDRSGRVVRSGISSKIDAAPAGTHYEGAPMLWFMRLTGEGVGMHVGILPGYAASHGCVRMPSDIAPMFYEKVRVGTPVVIRPD